MLGSGKHRDHTYLRSVVKVRDEKESAGKESDYFHNTSDSPIPGGSTDADLRRASLALDEVIREFEEKADGDAYDDKILIPRSPAPERASSLKSISVSGCVNGCLFCF